MLIWMLAALHGLTSPDAARTPPAPHCLDARAVTQVRQIAPDALLIATSGGRYRLQTEGECSAASEQAALLAAEGWMCGGTREFVQTGTALCAVRAVEALDQRRYAALAKIADQAARDGVAVMAAVESRGKRAAFMGFRGSPDYCFRPSQVQAWSEDGDGIVVQTRKLRSGGHSRYRVELDSNCPESAYLSVLTLRSGFGMDLVCGNTGDVAVFSGDSVGAGGGFRQTADQDSLLVSERVGRSSIRAVSAGCPIAEVYPAD